MESENVKVNFDDLTGKQKRFCEEYVIDWNASRAALVAGYSEKTAYSIGNENLKKPEIQSYIEHIQKDLAKLCGVSAAMIINEAKKIAFANLSDFKEDWMTEKDFNQLTPEQKAALSEIVYESRITKEGTNTIVKFKLHDKIKGMELLNKILGFNSPEKIDHSTLGKELTNTTTVIVPDKETAEKYQQLLKKFEDE
jgi:phage terminase small subunit